MMEHMKSVELEDDTFRQRVQIDAIDHAYHDSEGKPRNKFWPKI